VDVVLVDVVPEAVVIEVTAIEDLILLEVPEMCQSMNCSSSQDLKSSVFQLRIPHRSDRTVLHSSQKVSPSNLAIISFCNELT